MFHPLLGEGLVPRPWERERVAEGRVRAEGENPTLAGEGGPSTDISPKPGQLGVFWQTQGSGKSFSMVFFAQKVLRKVAGMTQLSQLQAVGRNFCALTVRCSTETVLCSTRTLLCLTRTEHCLT